jgi:hypothetical protein
VTVGAVMAAGGRPVEVRHPAYQGVSVSGGPLAVPGARRG